MFCWVPVVFWSTILAFNYRRPEFCVISSFCHRGHRFRLHVLLRVSIITFIWAEQKTENLPGLTHQPKTGQFEWNATISGRTRRRNPNSNQEKKKITEMWNAKGTSVVWKWSTLSHSRFRAVWEQRSSEAQSDRIHPLCRRRCSRHDNWVWTLLARSALLW